MSFFLFLNSRAHISLVGADSMRESAIPNFIFKSLIL